MAVVSPGDAVLELMRNATSRAIIAAPYIKSATIRRLIKEIPDTVSELVCVTRWLPEDIASGVCDLEIFDDVTRMQGGRLLIHPHLHAKYYSNGQETLVGSANLTARGLGWHTPANVEIVVALPAEFPGLADWESALLDSAIEATGQLRNKIHAQAEQIKKPGQYIAFLKSKVKPKRVNTLPFGYRSVRFRSGYGKSTVVTAATLW